MHSKISKLEVILWFLTLPDIFEDIELEILAQVKVVPIVAKLEYDIIDSLRYQYIRILHAVKD